MTPQPEAILSSVLGLAEQLELPAWFGSSVEAFNEEVQALLANEEGPGASRRHIEDLARRSLGGLLQAMSGAGRFTLGDEIGEYVRIAHGPRNLGIFAAVHGLQEDTTTQTEVAHREGVSRQRISQIIHRVQEACQTSSPPLVSVAILRGAAQHLGSSWSSAEWWSAGPRFIQPRDAHRDRALIVASDLGWLRGFTLAHRSGIWVRDGSSSTERASLNKEIQSVGRKVDRWLSKFGCVNPAGIADEHLLCTVDIVATVCEAKALRRIGSLYVGDGRNSVLVDRVCRMLSVQTKGELSEVRLQIEHSLGWAPSTAAVAEVLSHVDFLQVDRRSDTVSARTPLAPEDYLSPGEQAAVDILAAAGGALSHKDFALAIVARGFSSALAGIMAGNSAILRRPMHGVVSLWGTVLDSAQQRDFRAEVNDPSKRTFLGYANGPGGRLEIRYRVDPRLFSSTAFSVPVGRLPMGDWRVEGSDELITVQKSYVAGVHDHVRPHLRSDHDTLIILRFDPASRLISVSAL